MEELVSGCEPEKYTATSVLRATRRGRQKNIRSNAATTHADARTVEGDNPASLSRPVRMGKPLTELMSRCVGIGQNCS